MTVWENWSDTGKWCNGVSVHRDGEIGGAGGTPATGTLLVKSPVLYFISKDCGILTVRTDRKRGTCKV